MLPGYRCQGMLTQFRSGIGLKLPRGSYLDLRSPVVIAGPASGLRH
jgi:hypothetical protein